jgi:glucokinase
MITLETGKKILQYAIGIDLGGTFIKSAISDSNGKILKTYKTDTLADKGPKTVVKQIEKSINKLLAGFNIDISGIGIGAPGIVTGGVVKFPPNFKGWKEVDLKKHFHKMFKMEVEIDNDANCAGLAELQFGHGKKYENFIFLTLGTGIGGAIIINGKVYRGEQNGAGEFGMMTIKYDGTPCLGGNRGSVEAYLGRNYFLDSEKNEISSLGKKLDFNDIAKYASKKNNIAKDIFKRYGFYLGVGLTNYFNLMDVRTAVLGGGISNAYPYFIAECNKTIKNRCLPTIKNSFRVIKSEINNNAGVLGAAALIFENN